MITLSYGYQNPENGDRGSVWFPALNANIVRLNGHSHNGVDSALLSSVYIQNASVTTSTWTSNGTGSYKQTLTVPVGFNTTDFTMTTHLSTASPAVLTHIIHPSIEKVSASTFTIYTLDNTLQYTVVFR